MVKCRLPVPNISSVGSSQGAGNVGRMADFSKFFGKLIPAEYSGQMIERMNAKTLQERTRSDILKNEQDIRESVSRTIENKRNTAFKKSLETTLFNQEQQTLNNLRLQNKQMDFDLQYNIDTRDIPYGKEGVWRINVWKSKSIWLLWKSSANPWFVSRLLRISPVWPPLLRITMLRLPRQRSRRKVCRFRVLCANWPYCS